MMRPSGVSRRVDSDATSLPWITKIRLLALISVASAAGTLDPDWRSKPCCSSFLVSAFTPESRSVAQLRIPLWQRFSTEHSQMLRKRKRHRGTQKLLASVNDENEAAYATFLMNDDEVLTTKEPLLWKEMDPSKVDIHDFRLYRFEATVGTENGSPEQASASSHLLKSMMLQQNSASDFLYPFAAMMQTAAPYIASHAGKIAVIHVPADILEQDKEDHHYNLDKDDTQKSTSSRIHFMDDIALSWLLGIKIVLVIGPKYSLNATEGSCDVTMAPHECHNALKTTNARLLRHVEEEAGYLRTEVERKLNRRLRMHGASGSTNVDSDDSLRSGNVVSGNFYTAQQFGVVQGRDFGFTGCVTSVQNAKIRKILENLDVVLLTTIGYGPSGELVNVNGYHLAASVAASLDAYKLVFMANEGSLLVPKLESKSSTRRPLQEIPLSFAKSLCQHHEVSVHNTGYATFGQAKLNFAPIVSADSTTDQGSSTVPGGQSVSVDSSGATELLLHLGWSAWALEQGVRRAHVVNPFDGAILEELFTSKNGANTCVIRDNELAIMQKQQQRELDANVRDLDDELIEDSLPIAMFGSDNDEDWNAVLESAAKAGRNIPSFRKL
jgi:acetylglutamate kinase